MGLEAQKTDLEQMPQITPEGVSGDYYNVLVSPLMQYRDFCRGIEGVVADIRAHPLLSYTDRYPSTQYEGVVTTFNREAVNRLDAIAAELNTLANDGALTDEKYRGLHIEACKLLFGAVREEDFGDGRGRGPFHS